MTIRARDVGQTSGKSGARVEFDEAEDRPLFERCATIADLVAAGACELVESTDWRFDVIPARGFALAVSELLRADLDGDDAEEILVFDLAYATGGTFRAGTVSVAKPGIDGIIRLLRASAASRTHSPSFTPGPSLPRTGRSFICIRGCDRGFSSDDEGG